MFHNYNEMQSEYKKKLRLHSVIVDGAVHCFIILSEKVGIILLGVD